MSIPLSNLVLTEKAKEYAISAIRTGWVSGTGEYIPKFESALASKAQRRYAVAVANGTLALELALRALGIRPGDEVIVPALTFVAPAATVKSVGATPVLVDIDPFTWTLSPERTRRAITRRTQVIIAVDLLGHPADYDALYEVAGDIPIIEDAAEAHGTLYKGKPCGSFGLISTFSFHANKTIGIGEGGAALTDDEELADRMRLVANHGMTKERPYWHSVVGTNYRMTNVTAALGLGQVEAWDDFVAARREVAAMYNYHLAGSGITRRPVAPFATEACWLYTVLNKSGVYKGSHQQQREPVLKSLNEAGIDARAIWPALSDLPIYKPYGDFRLVSQHISRCAIWLPTYAYMPEEQVKQVADMLISAISPVKV